MADDCGETGLNGGSDELSNGGRSRYLVKSQKTWSKSTCWDLVASGCGDQMSTRGVDYWDIEVTSFPISTGPGQRNIFYFSTVYVLKLFRQYFCQDHLLLDVISSSGNFRRYLYYFLHLIFPKRNLGNILYAMTQSFLRVYAWRSNLRRSATFCIMCTFGEALWYGPIL